MQELPAQAVSVIVVIVLVVGGMPIAIMMAIRSSKGIEQIFGAIGKPAGKAIGNIKDMVDDQRKKSPTQATLEQRRRNTQNQALTNAYSSRANRQAASANRRARRANMGFWAKRLDQVKSAPSSLASGAKGIGSAVASPFATASEASQTTESEFRSHLSGEAVKRLGSNNLNASHLQAYAAYGDDSAGAEAYLRASGQLKDLGKLRADVAAATGTPQQADAEKALQNAENEYAAYHETVRTVKQRGIGTTSEADRRAVMNYAASQGSVLMGGTDASTGRQFKNFADRYEQNVAVGSETEGPRDALSVERGQIAFNARMTAGGNGQVSLRSGKVKKIFGGADGDVGGAMSQAIKSVNPNNAASIQEVAAIFANAELTREFGGANTGQRNNYDKWMQEKFASEAAAAGLTPAQFRAEIDAAKNRNRNNFTLAA